MPLPDPVSPARILSARPGGLNPPGASTLPNDIQLVAVHGRWLDQVRTALERSGYRVDEIGPAAVALESPPSRASAVLRVGALTIDPRRHEIRVDDRAVSCTPIEFGVLESLATHPGHVLTREQLLEHLHGAARFRDLRTIDSHVRNLRRKLGERSGARIVTVFGVGYKLAEVTETERSGMSAGIDASSAPHSARDR